jgi:hypothetical protein
MVVTNLLSIIYWFRTIPTLHKRFGRPRRAVNQDEMRRLRSEGASFRQIAENLGVGYGAVRLRLAQAGELITHRKTALLRPEN